jgi:hypothetical protein
MLGKTIAGHYITACALVCPNPCRYPTIADLAGIALPRMLFGGESLRPLLLASAAEPEIHRKTAMQQAGESTLASASWSSTTPPMTSLAGVRHQHVVPPGRAKGWALSQWPRRPSCLTSHGCLDGHGDPFAWEPDQAVMGYTLRVDGYRCVVSKPFGFPSKC